MTKAIAFRLGTILADGTFPASECLHVRKFLSGKHSHTNSKPPMNPLSHHQIKTTALHKRVRILPLAIVLISAATQAHSAVMIHDYQLNGNLTDVLGGPDLTSEGGTIGASTYAFGPNQGLTLSNIGLTNPGNYSIEMRVSLASLNAPTGNPWIKLIDFKDLTSDNGLYSYDGQLDNTGSILQFYPFGGTLDTFTPGTYANVVITRDGTTKEVVTYAQGFGQFSFTDSTDQAVFSNGIARFLQDDFPTQQAESGSGAIDFIRIYDSVLTADEVADANVPDGGSTVALLGLAMTGIAAVRRKLGSRAA
jgi:hypothetical protein